MNKKLKSIIKLLLKITITGGGLYYVFINIPFKETMDTIISANFLWLVVAMFLFVLSKVVSSFRLNLFFKNIGVYFSEKQNLKLYWLGMCYNLILPGGIGGDGYKVYIINKKLNIKTTDAFWAVMIDRVIGVLALFCMAVIFFIFVPLNFPYKMLAILLIPLSLFVAFLVIKKFFVKHLHNFIQTNLQSLLVQVLQLLCAMIILISLHHQEQMIEYLLVFLVSSIVAVLPFTIGGAGARELAFYFGSQILHLDQQISIALSLLFYAITVIVSLAGVYYIFKPVSLENKTIDEAVR